MKISQFIFLWCRLILVVVMKGLKNKVRWSYEIIFKNMLEHICLHRKGKRIAKCIYFSIMKALRMVDMRLRKKLFGGDTSTTKEASKEAPRQYKLRKEAMIISHPYQVNNVLILTIKINNIPLEDMYISKDFENKKQSKPIKKGLPPLNPMSPYNSSLDLAKPPP